MVPPVPMEGFTKDGAVVLHQVESDNTQLAQWLVRCACGEEFVRRGSDIRLKQHLRCRSCANKHIGDLNRKHGETGEVLHNLWSAIVRRCNDKAYIGYHNYGGRGIVVCHRWLHSYSDFAADIRSSIGERPSSKHSIDRINNNGNYEPGNVRWATPSEQMLNRRPSSQWKGKPGRPRKLHPLHLLAQHVDALLGSP